jgi:hypothetical protein
MAGQPQDLACTECFFRLATPLPEQKSNKRGTAFKVFKEAPFQTSSPNKTTALTVVVSPSVHFKIVGFCLS